MKKTIKWVDWVGDDWVEYCKTKLEELELEHITKDHETEVSRN